MNKRLIFWGPVYRFGKYLGYIPKKKSIITQADTEAEGLRNLDYKIKRYFTLPEFYRVEFDKSRVLIQDPPISDDTPVIENPPECPHCGYRLNDAGNCPVCDYAEYDLLDSSEAMKMLCGMPE